VSFKIHIAVLIFPTLISEFLISRSRKRNAPRLRRQLHNFLAESLALSRALTLVNACLINDITDQSIDQRWPNNGLVRYIYHLYRNIYQKGHE